MIRQTQDLWLDSNYLASSFEGGLATPDFERIAQAFGLSAFSIRLNAELPSAIQSMIDHEGPILCNIEVRPDHRVIPQVKFGRPNEDQDPLLKRDEFFANMLIPILDVSLD